MSFRLKLGQRHVLVVLGHIGILLTYVFRTNLSVALVAMVNTTVIDGNSSGSQSQECPAYIDNSTAAPDTSGEFFWTEKERGILLGSFFWGYMVMQIPAGILIQQYGAKWLFGFSVLITSILNAATPLVARAGGLQGTIALRVVEGLLESVTFPAAHSLAGRWFHPTEVSLLALGFYCGADLGRLLGMYVTGALCESTWFGGWPSAFYVTGIAGLIWFPFWCFFVYESPLSHPWIKSEERDFLNALRKIETHPSWKELPLRSILTSVPVWTYFICSFIVMWTTYTLMTCLPQYLTYILHFSLSQNGIESALPYGIHMITGLVSCYVADVMRVRGTLSTTNVRKLFTTIGFLGSGLSILCVAFVGCNRVLSVGLLDSCLIFLSFLNAGISMNDLDMAPNLASFIFSMANTWGTLAGIIGPAVVGYLTDDAETIGQWSILFYITAILDLIGIVIYLLFGSGERQPWALNEYRRIDEVTLPENDEPTHVEHLTSISGTNNA